MTQPFAQMTQKSELLVANAGLFHCHDNDFTHHQDIFGFKYTSAHLGV